MPPGFPEGPDMLPGLGPIDAVESCLSWCTDRSDGILAIDGNGLAPKDPVGSRFGMSLLGGTRSTKLLRYSDSAVWTPKFGFAESIDTFVVGAPGAALYDELKNPGWPVNWFCVWSCCPNVLWNDGVYE